MLANSILYDLVQACGIDLITGVPDSVLAPAIDFFDTTPIAHVRAANEGNAVGVAIGNYVATSKPAMVYLQNSGLSNALNPLLSLAHDQVYRVPLLLVIGWRGMPGKSDEPQHMVQGQITESMVGFFSDSVFVMSNAPTEEQLELLRADLEARKIVTVLVPPGSFAREAANAASSNAPEGLPSRIEVIDAVIQRAEPSDLIVATTGYTGRELSARLSGKKSAPAHLLVVGGMGHASSISLGAASHWPGRVICLDGDGAALMHLGALAANGAQRPENLIHIVLANGMHESVGRQPVSAPQADLAAVAKTLGYEVRTLTVLEDLDSVFRKSTEGKPIFCEIAITAGTIENLPRPTLSPQELLDDLFLKRGA